jgi:heme A synthase
VQATSSGAGCGENWPRCDGALLPGLGDQATVVEFVHRMLTTALSIGFAVMVVAAWRLYGTSHRVFKATVWSSVFLVLEILIGAALVLFGWVEDDASMGRVVADAAHVVNTFLMVGALTLTAFFAGGGPSVLRTDPRRGRLLGGAAVIVAVAISGAINSLADTLAVTESVDLDSTPLAGLLVAVRGVHPFMAILGGLAVFAIVRSLTSAEPWIVRLSWGVQIVIVAQFVVGIANIALLTPMETQVAHLLLADALWILYVLFTAARLTTSEAGIDSTPPRERADR